MTAEKIRLGGMALGNGVLVHGPRAWACAIRTESGELKVVAKRKRLRASEVENPFLRGPARLAEAFALLPQLKRALPEAKLPFERPRVIGSMVASAIVVNAAKRSSLRPAARELLAAVLSFAPAALALRGGELAEYHGAEHISIGRYEHGEDRPKEHERCGSHLVGPMLMTTAAGNLIAEHAPERYRQAARLTAGLGAVAASVELFGWMTRNPKHPLARALSKPGYELQHRSGTREPSREQLEVAETALQACLELER
ncbi:MAG TPA: DUF1385 domain-containing protein [Gaiellaceae bacterium]|jgi:uncharacterized protein YqhQ|nr:DUF1385 domain-containing protein [Gaiellaceae bacterium]